MFFLRRPGAAQVARFLQEQQAASPTYSQTGWTREGACPPGYHLDQHRRVVGQGTAAFERARQALRAQAPFRLGWMQPMTPGTPIQPGETLVFLVHHLGFYSLIADRVVYVLDEPTRFGFAYGTLPGHPEQGEERFLLTLDASSDVTFELLAFSRPRHPLARLGSPFVRWLQVKASQGYLEAMRRAVTAA